MLANGSIGADPEEEMHCSGPPGACTAGNDNTCQGGAANQDYYAWGRCVRAPVAGKVLSAWADQPDHCPGAAATGYANGVFFHLGGGYTVGMYHFQNQGVSVKAGTVLPLGAPLGVVGDSGYAAAPHIHMSLYWRGKDAPCCIDWSIPSAFKSLYVKDSGLPAEVPAQSIANLVPTTGQFVSNDPFTENANAPSGACPTR